MREKYLVRHHAEEDLLLGLYRSGESVICGGSCVFSERVRDVLSSFGDGEPIIRQHQGSHRHRQILEGVSEEAWKSGLLRVQEYGYMLREVRSFRRLMT